MRGVQAVLDMLAHPAPGLLFPRHERAGVGPTVIATPHEAEPPATQAQLRWIHNDYCPDAPALAKQLKSLFSLHNGIVLCSLPDESAAMFLLPIEYWDDASEECSELVEGRETYEAGSWRVIGGFSSEGTKLILFLDGEHDGKPLAGKCCCVSMDPIMDCEDEIARSFDELLLLLAEQHVELLNKVGYTWTAKGRDGMLFGWPPQQYLPDVRDNELLAR